jgi:hypothetical protein
MLTRNEVEKLIAEPKLFADPSFAKDTFLRDVGQLLLGAIYRQNAIPVDGASLRAGGDETLFSILDARRMLAFYAFDLGVDTRLDSAARVKFLDRASQTPQPDGGIFHDPLGAGAATILVRDGPSLPGQYEICQKRVVAWYLAALRRAS